MFVFNYAVLATCNTTGNDYNVQLGLVFHVSVYPPTSRFNFSNRFLLMASWQHVALGAVAAAGVGLALYHAKNHKTEEILEKERAKLYRDAHTGNARFVQRMTDPVRTRDRWRSMDLHEKKAVFHIDR